MNLTYDMGVGQIFPIRITFGRLYRANSNGCYKKRKSTVCKRLHRVDI